MEHPFAGGEPGAPIRHVRRTRAELLQRPLLHRQVQNGARDQIRGQQVRLQGLPPADRCVKFVQTTPFTQEKLAPQHLPLFSGTYEVQLTLAPMETSSSKANFWVRDIRHASHTSEYGTTIKLAPTKSDPI